jgi:hypothetical protein
MKSIILAAALLMALVNVNANDKEHNHKPQLNAPTIEGGKVTVVMEKAKRNATCVLFGSINGREWYFIDFATASNNGTAVWTFRHESENEMFYAYYIQE